VNIHTCGINNMSFNIKSQLQVQLEIRSVERGIWPIAESTMTEAVI